MMSQLLPAQVKLQERAVVQAKLLQRNKEAAREQLLRIQLLLAQKPIK